MYESFRDRDMSLPVNLGQQPHESHAASMRSGVCGGLPASRVPGFFSISIRVDPPDARRVAGSRLLDSAIRNRQPICVGSDRLRSVTDCFDFVDTMSGGNRLASGVVANQRTHTELIFLQSGTNAKLRRS
jgi:hypothetical protein